MSYHSDKHWENNIDKLNSSIHECNFKNYNGKAIKYSYRKNRNNKKFMKNCIFFNLSGMNYVYPFNNTNDMITYDQLVIYCNENNIFISEIQYPSFSMKVRNRKTLECIINNQPIINNDCVRYDVKYTTADLIICFKFVSQQDVDNIVTMIKLKYN